MKLKVFLLIGLHAFYFAQSFTGPSNYLGDKMLTVLGENKGSAAAREFKNFWLLDAKYRNANSGIKLNINSKTGDVTSIFIAGEDMLVDSIPFMKFTSKLPLGLTLNDDTAVMDSKLGQAKKLPEKNAFRFHKKNIFVEVTYANIKKGKISSLKFSAEPKPPVPVKVYASIEKNPPVVVTENKPVPPRVLTAPTSENEKKSASMMPPLKKAILEVFNANRESAFYSIKTEERTARNFWNYRYTYNTKLKIPGEMYDMLYSFPFITSPLDYVAILKESDVYDKSFETTYHYYEKQLLESFPASDGWVSSCISNGSKAKLSDLALHNDKYGGIVLDYSENPKGRHVLYLRFLLYDN